jgi:hypothetical protein
VEDCLCGDGAGRAVKGFFSSRLSFEKRRKMFFFSLCNMMGLSRARAKRRSWSFCGREEYGRHKRGRTWCCSLLLTFFFSFRSKHRRETSISFKNSHDGSSTSSSQVWGAALLRRMGLTRGRAGRGGWREGVVGDPEPVRRRR